MDKLQVLKNRVIELNDAGMYQRAAENVTKALNVKLKILDVNFGYHFAGDTQKRYIFKCRLKRNGKQYTFNFGQSIVAGCTEPNFYDLFTCLTKYDVGSFNDFCSEYGYDVWDKSTKKVYKAVVREFEGIQRLFNSEELDLLQEIQ